MTDKYICIVLTWYLRSDIEGRRRSRSKYGCKAEGAGSRQTSGGYEK